MRDGLSHGSGEDKRGRGPRGAARNSHIEDTAVQNVCVDRSIPRVEDQSPGRRNHPSTALGILKPKPSSTQRKVTHTRTRT